MRIKSIFLIFVFLSLFSTSVYASDKEKIIVTIKPLHSLVQNIVGNGVEVGLLLDGTDTPHDFQLTPSQIAKITKSDVVFYIDEDFETFLKPVLKILSKETNKVSFLENENLELLEVRENTNDSNHDDHNDKHHDHHGDIDPHIWLDPQNAKVMVEVIYTELVKKYPNNKEIYKENKKSLFNKLDLLNYELKDLLKDYNNESFVVFHDAYQYFESRYNLKSISSITFDPTIASSAKQISKIKKKITDENIKCIFKEPQFSDRLINAVIVDTDVNISISVLDPLGGKVEKGTGQYFDLIRDLANNIKNCLQ